ncbi:DDE-type integrase/transposase/recombinase [Pseudoteredinibacter isoporae]|uniref:DDE-type integrase/transposase/recombinase n=1 Tax=Pseudoteredinibacter isoporae TaxID=570281 RepID=UPI003529676C
MNFVITSHSLALYHNNIAEISHQKTRQQERQMRRFKSVGQAQRFLACHGVINNHFRQQRHLLKAKYYPELRNRAFSQWQQVPVPRTWKLPNNWSTLFFFIELKS